MDQLFYALTAILQPTIALLFQVHFLLTGSIKSLKTLKLQDHTYQDHFCSMCPRSLELSSSYTTNHDDELESLFLSRNQESVFMADSIDDRSSGFTPDDGRGLSWVATNFQFIFSLALFHSPTELSCNFVLMLRFLSEMHPICTHCIADSIFEKK